MHNGHQSKCELLRVPGFRVSVENRAIAGPYGASPRHDLNEQKELRSNADRFGSKIAPLC